MKRSILAFLTLTVFLFSCSDDPKVISVEETGADNTTGIFSNDPMNGTVQTNSVNKEDVHTIEVLEVIQGAKYSYLQVAEGDEHYWIATGKQEVDTVKTYFYKNRLLKTDLYVEELDRTFERIFLVTQIVPTDHGYHPGSIATTNTGSSNTEPVDVNRSGSIKIVDLVGSAEEYRNKTVQISGVVVKVNRKIMGRNWIHIKDGSMDDFDLVITSDMDVPEGHTVTMTATVALNEDFGAGYKYDIILENGVLMP